MAAQSWQCSECGLYNNNTRRSCQACFHINKHIASAIAPNGYFVPKKRLDAIARILLMAVYDDNHVFSSLRGIRFIVKSIWEYTLSFNRHIWPTYIEEYGCYGTYVLQKCPVHFPEPQNLNINMMPFIASRDFEETKLPQYLQPYFDALIKPCLGSTDLDYDRIDYHCSHRVGDIFYLTIQESLVDAERTQRRPGLHVETPGGTKQGYQIMWGCGSHYNYDAHGGLFMASSVDQSCAIWNCKIVQESYYDDVSHEKDAIGHLGDIEHLRSNLPAESRQVMKANVLYWLTDRTPHEALPVDKPVYRQFFRLVTSEVSVWYEQHSTKNPNGVVPDEEITRIVEGNKFCGK